MARRLKIIPNENHHPGKSGDPDEYEKRLEQALADRDQFLAENPDYIPYQEEIDTILSKAGTVENRMVVLAVMMEAKLNELTHHFQGLSDMLTVQMARHQWGLNEIG